MFSELERIRQLATEINARQTECSRARNDRARTLAREHLSLWIGSIEEAIRRNPNCVFVYYYYSYSPSDRFWFKGNKEGRMDPPIDLYQFDLPAEIILLDSFMEAYAAELTLLLKPPFRVKHGKQPMTDDHTGASYLSIEWWGS